MSRYDELLKKLTEDWINFLYELSDECDLYEVVSSEGDIDYSGWTNEHFSAYANVPVDKSISCSYDNEGNLEYAGKFKQVVDNLVSKWNSYPELSSVSLNEDALKDGLIYITGHVSDLSHEESAEECVESYTPIADKDIPIQPTLQGIETLYEDYVIEYTVKYDRDTKTFTNYNEAYKFFDKQVHDSKIDECNLTIHAVGQFDQDLLTWKLFEKAPKEVAPILEEEYPNTTFYSVNYTDIKTRKNKVHEERFATIKEAKELAYRLKGERNCHSLEINKLVNGEFAETLKCWELQKTGIWEEFDPQTNKPFKKPIKEDAYDEKANHLKEFQNITFPKDKDTNLKNWYKAEFPTDELGDKIPTNTTFKTIFDLLQKHKDVYPHLAGDSIVRERVFDELCNILDCDYDDIYYTWLETGKPISSKQSSKNTFGNASKDQVAKMDAWHNGERKENIRACSDNKLKTFLQICKNKEYQKEVDEIEQELRSRGIDESLTEKKQSSFSDVTEIIEDELTKAISPYKSDIEDIKTRFFGGDNFPKSHFAFTVIWNKEKYSKNRRTSSRFEEAIRALNRTLFSLEKQYPSQIKTFRIDTQNPINQRGQNGAIWSNSYEDLAIEAVVHFAPKTETQSETQTEAIDYSITESEDELITEETSQGNTIVSPDFDIDLSELFENEYGDQYGSEDFDISTVEYDPQYNEITLKGVYHYKGKDLHFGWTVAITSLTGRGDSWFADYFDYICEEPYECEDGTEVDLNNYDFEWVEEGDERASNSKLGTDEDEFVFYYTDDDLKTYYEYQPCYCYVFYDPDSESITTWNEFIAWCEGGDSEDYIINDDDIEESLRYDGKYEYAEEEDSTKREALAKYLNCSIDDLERNDAVDDYGDLFGINLYTVKNGEHSGEEYLVLKGDKEREQAVYDDIDNTIEGCGGIKETFTPTFVNLILDRRFNYLAWDKIYEKAYEDCSDWEGDTSGESFIDSLKKENLSKDELKEKVLDYWIESWRSEKEFLDYCYKHNLVNLWEITKASIDMDGYGLFLSSWDGEEIELGNEFYAYRNN